MGQSCMNFKWLVVSYIHCSILVMSMAVSSFDEQVLLDFKSRITDDPFQVMSSWNNSHHYCNWTGITCNPSIERVMILDLRSLKLVGSIPPSIGNLTFLTAINLRNNSFHGELPMEIGNLLQLQHLNLTWNSFTGTIPANLSYCKELRSLALEYNSLVGKVLPDQLSSLSKLNYLGLGSNNLTGSIPSWIGNFSVLRGLSLAINNLKGPIPRDIGRLSNLQIFQVYGNQLNGTIPQSVFNISSVYYFSVTQNLLYGELPSDIGLTLPNLEVFAGAVNDFTGPIPVSLSNASKLGVLELSQNKLTGNVPTSLGQLQGLYRMNFEINSLGRNTSEDLRFLDFLVNCTSLQVLSFENNFLGGELPRTIGNLSTRLEIFALGNNMIGGSLPTELENLVNLTFLSLDNNYLRGNVPESLGKLRRLQELMLNGNKLSGRIPSSIGNLTSLSTLLIEDNELEGNIPRELGQFTRLSVLNLTGNNLVGSIPKELANLFTLSIALALANNSLTGSLPAEIGKLINLKEMDISHNKLSGEIPSTLSSCVSLERFIANNNLFRGEIPESLQGLRGLEEIDLSHNNISGGIPKFLRKLPYLRKVDLSFNELEGEVPTEGIFANASAVSISGNDELCGGPPNYNFPACPTRKDASSKKHISTRTKVAIIVSVTFLVLLLCSFVVCYIVIRTSRKRDLTGRSSRERQSEHFDDDEPTLFNDPILAAKITYQDIFKSTNGFSEDNLVGTGSFGSVYKGQFQVFDKVMAVKVLKLQQRGALKSFTDECRVLKTIRHRNLLKIIAVCSSIDYQGNDFKCIVFEFMENGSLDDWLHSKGDEQYLNIIQRLNIAIDVASALDYLHNNCQVPIVHCDLKPSNILLDEEMTARVGDFGLAKFLFKSSWNKQTSTALKGSIGYIPPEYGSGVNVSTLGDVYSFGIMLLELFTGRRPTDEIFNDGLNIHQYVKVNLPRRVTEIADPSLLLAYEEHNRSYEDNASDLEEKAILQDDEYISKLNTSTMIEGCLVSILKIGLLCSSSWPRDRMPISIALKEIHTIKNLFLQSKRINDSIDRSDGNKLIKLSSSEFY